MSLKLTILGCHSATPRSDAHPTSQVLEIKNGCYLIDCGEGTQKQLRKFQFKFSKIENIFISHLHGDHFFGLIGLISTFSLLKRQNDLHIFAPKGAKEIIDLQLKITKSYLHYNLIIHELETKSSTLIFEDKNVSVHTIPLKHRIYTNGFLFIEKRGERKLNIEAIKQFPDIDICDYQNLKNGRDFTRDDGSIVDNSILTFDPKKTFTYAYCSDTAFTESIIPIIKHVDLLYHESTFLEKHSDLAQLTKHSTALEAAKIAKMAQVKKLLLGHYSSRYKDLNAFKIEASKIFNNVELSYEGASFYLND